MSILRNEIKNNLTYLKNEIEHIFEGGRDTVLSEVTVGQVYGGMRGLTALVCNTSYVDPYSGLHIGDFTVEDLSEKYPEEIFYLLCTGKLPESDFLEEFRKEMNERSGVPQYTWDVLKALPEDTHPMSMLSLGILTMEQESVFKRNYLKGIPKSDFWKYTFEDALNVIAKLPELAAGIYRIRFGDGTLIKRDPDLDWAGNLAMMLGLPNSGKELARLMRLYLVLHCDHEGGNVSAFTSRVVNSALSSLYYAISAGLNGLAGPLHGLANQNCLKFILEIRHRFGDLVSEEEIALYIKETLDSGKVIPGYGHAVLRVTDPRFTAFMKFGKAYCSENVCFQIAEKLFKVVPDILKTYKGGKVASPWPNVDAASGALLFKYGLNQFDFYTVLFGVSRILGFCAQNILAQGLGQPIIRPKSVTNKWVADQLMKNKVNH
ncbi:citrate (Si)-synthase [Marinifilum caeruleilacunae]|nr:citrate (Si)-synthase [Marinifilum caeruleilacunae]